MTSRKTHAQNIAASDRRSTDTTKSGTAHEQQVSELLRVLRAGWRGQWAEFESFSASYLTAKGERMAKEIAKGCEDRKAASAAIRAGY